MRGVFIEDRIATVARSPFRADVALFVGFVDRRRAKHVGGAPNDETLVQTVVPDLLGGGGDADLYRWLVRNGWARGDVDRDRSNGIDELLDVPVPIDAPATFDRLFAGEARAWSGGQCDTYLRAAVRAFFAEGGRLCYVARVGAPWPVPMTLPEVEGAVAQRTARIAALIPGFPGAASASPVERETWKGAWTLYGLPDVSFVALPDLPDVVRAPLPDVEPPKPRPPLVEFAECSDAPAEPADDVIAALRGPLADDDAFTVWHTAVRTLVARIEEVRTAGSLREVHALVALPRPADDRAGSDLLAYLSDLPGRGLDASIDDGGLESRFLQLAYPWLRSGTSAALPEAIVPPDGALAGALARNALARGTFRSAAGRSLADAHGFAPPLRGRDLGDPSDTSTLGGRVTLLGDTAMGAQVLSDVTTEPTVPFRLAHASRLVASIERALRTIGESLVFEVNGEETWFAVRSRVSTLLGQFWQAGALRGATAADAFSVRCDRATMTQDDLDAGRLIAEVEIALTVSIQRINLVLTRTADGVSLERAA
jgi:hypothetical protein